MTAIVRLEENLDPARTGYKFANLGRVNGIVLVPRAICVTQDAFRDSLDKELGTFLGLFFEELRATVGCFLLSTYPQLEERIAGLSLSKGTVDQLARELEAVFGPLEGRKFAVRSSGATEDSAAFSFAGVYQTLLNVEGMNGILQAVVACWMSYYSYTAVAARIRANQFSPDPDMAVIVQEMIPSELSGVSFTQGKDRQVVTEYVEGLGEQLVSGAVTPTRHREGEAILGSSKETLAIQAAESAAKKLAVHLGYAVDVEWAWADGCLHVLQVRPVTAELDRNKLQAPLWIEADLYGEGGLPEGLQLGDCREVYVSYVTKRASSYRLAVLQGVPVPGAHLICFNGAALLHEPGLLERLLRSTSSSQAVLDISSNIRQVVLDKEDVLHYLTRTLALDTERYREHTVIIRDFVRGEFGFISRRIGERGEGVLVEYSADGLMDINRGIASCHRIVVKDSQAEGAMDTVSCSGPSEDALRFRNALPVVAAFTGLINERLPGTQLEWALENGVPYFIDFSREMDEVPYEEVSGSIVISAGTASGPLYELTNDEMLYKLSIGPAVSVDKTADVLEHAGLQQLIQEISQLDEKPILYVQRPYAILSTLFDHIAGFIFAEGSLLCHLAILLREAHIPSVISKDLRAEEGTAVLIADGLVRSIQKDRIFK